MAASPPGETAAEGCATPPVCHSCGGQGVPRNVDESGLARPSLDDTVGKEDTVGEGTPAPLPERDPAGGWPEGFLVAERFRIVRRVGQGGMGTVYLAQDETLGRQIALKRIPQEVLYDGDARDDLRDEANRLLDLAHENIVRVHTYYDGPSWPFFAMEFLQGPTLKKLLLERAERGTCFAPHEVLAIARQVGRGLAHAHAKGVIHRDLKPSNLMLASTPGHEIRDTDVVKITDFGIARVVADGSLRQKSRRSGTLPYMSPEQYRGEPSTVQSDVYSFACTLYELASGKPPFQTGDIGYQIQNRVPSPIPGISRAMNQAISKGLAKDPRRRFRSVDELIRALESRSAGGLRVPPGGWKGVRSPWGGVAVASTIVVCSALLFVITGGLRGTREEPAGHGPAPAALLPRPSQADPVEREFRDRLLAEVRKQILPIMGQPHVSRRMPSPSDPSISLGFLAFTYPRAMSSSEKDLLDGLVLEFYHRPDDEEDEPGARDRPPVVHKAKGQDLPDGRKAFELGPLEQGDHTLNAYIEGPSGPPRRILENFRFSVDLVAPTLDIDVVNPRAFLEALPPYRTTFDAAIDLSIVSSDIAEAYFQVVADGVVPPVSQRIEDPTRWELRLPIGLTSYRVFAKDAAGNRSHATEIGFRRLRLSVDSFELAYPVWGNLAHVKGVIIVDGEEPVSLRYFINDQPVDPEPMGSSTAPPDDTWSPMSERGASFSHLLRLPDVVNLIELMYSWKGNSPRPFAVPARITDVRLKTPQITMYQFPDRTNSARMHLAGRVEPYFTDLGIRLENKGQGSLWLTTRPSSGGDYATFEKEIQLLPDQDNTIEIECFYRDRRIPGTAWLRTVVCDQKRPRLLRVKCQPFDDLLQVTIDPSEQLRLLRIKELLGMERESEWRVVQLLDFSPSYQYDTSVPTGPLTFQIEMTDLAGNVAVEDARMVLELPPPKPPEPESVDVAKSSGPAVDLQDDPSLKERPAPPAPTRRDPSQTPRYTEVQSDFVKEMRLEFRPFGTEKLEMSLTEVPERPWLLFLRDKRGLPPPDADLIASEGRLDHPMVIGDELPELLREFVKWFELHSNDGYTYFIPTRAQWMAAFAGQGDPRKAEERIKDWFQRSFDPSPSVRYSFNKIQRIGSRPENRTPTGLLDMESNLQELVLDGETLKVIGGSNRDSESRMLEYCLKMRLPSDDFRRMTGFRMCRMPAR